MRVLLRTVPLLRSAARFAIPFKPYSTHASAGYYVLLPEIPDDTPETNSFLRLGEIPQYKGITGEMAYNGLAKRMLEYEDNFYELEQKIQDPEYPKTFETTLGEVDRLQVPVLNAWHNLKHLSLIKDEEEFTGNFRRLSTKFQAVVLKCFHSDVIYSVVKDLSKQIDSFEPDQQRLIRIYELECKLAGLDLGSDKVEAVRGYNRDIMLASFEYSRKLEEATGAFRHRISESIMKNFPDHLLHHFATSSGFIATLYEPQHSIFLAYCGDRSERWNLYQARAIRCSTNNTERYNVDEIEKARVAKHYLATLFDFNWYAEYSLSTKMAPSVAVVRRTLDVLAEKISPVAERQMNELKAFCAEKGFKAPLERWDLPYWRRRYRDAKLAIDEEDIKQLFGLPAVIDGLARLVDKLFGVELRQVTLKEPLWAEDVILFEVAVNGKTVGRIFLDLQARGEKESGNSCTVLSAANASQGVLPAVSVIMSLNKSTYISLAELGELLKQMGSALQHTLSRARYSQSAGLANLPHDVSQICPQFMNMLLLEKRFARMLSAGEALPDDYHEKIVQQKLHLYAVDVQFEIFKSVIDLDLYSTKDFSEDIVRRVYKDIVKATPWQYHETFFFGGFPEVIVGGFQAGYYSHLWGSMLAAEAFQAMHECPEEDMYKVSRRFCESMMLDGGCVAPSEAFRKFRGRDPTTDSFLAVCNLK